MRAGYLRQQAGAKLRRVDEYVDANPGKAWAGILVASGLVAALYGGYRLLIRKKKAVPLRAA